MKKILHLLLAAFITVSVMGQPINLKTFGKSNMKIQNNQNNLHLLNKTSTNKINQLKTASVEKHRLDSIISESWDDQAGIWIIYNKEFFTYDEDGNNTLDISYDWNEPMGQWEKNRTELFYDSNGNVIEQIDYNWDDDAGDWLGTSKQKLTFDLNGKKEEFFIFEWNESNNLWDTNTIAKYIYKDSLTGIYYFQKNEPTSDWDTVYISENFSNASGKDTLSIAYSQDDTTSKWIASMKAEYAYDTNGNNTSFIWYFTQDTSNVLTPRYKYENTYDANENQILSIDYSWDNTDSLWIPDGKNENTYDANGNQILSINYIWDNTDSLWLPESKDEIAYDNSFLFNDLILPFYLNYAGFFSHKILSSISYAYNAPNWDLSERTYLYYSDPSISGITNEQSQIKLNVFPNPASEFVIFKLEGASTDMNLELYDLLGRKVIVKTIENNVPVSVQNLNDGLYMIKLNHNGTISTGKFVVRH